MIPFLPGNAPVKLSDEYIRGLVEGEGTFTFSTSKDYNGRIRKIPTFTIKMHIRDLHLLESVKYSLGLKNRVYAYNHQGHDGHKRGPQAMLIVREFPQLKNIIVPFFYKKLIGNKGRQFNEWMERIGTDPDVSRTFKVINLMYKHGYYDKNKFFHRVDV